MFMKKVLDDNCLFCKLANGQIPTNSIYEDEDFNVIMDLDPASRGHCIILPKTHASNLYELPEESCQKIFSLAKKCGTVLKDTLHCDGLNVLQNNGEVAGQTQFHLHVHLLPRYKDDSVDIKFQHGTVKESVEETAEIIRKGF